MVSVAPFWVAPAAYETLSSVDAPSRDPSIAIVRTADSTSVRNLGSICIGGRNLYHNYRPLAFREESGASPISPARHGPRTSYEPRSGDSPQSRVEDAIPVWRGG